MTHKASFFVDESSFSLFDITAVNADQLLFKITNLISGLHGEDDNIWKWSEIWVMETVNGLTLSDLLFSADSPIDRDIRRRLGSILERVGDWDLDPSYDGTEIEVRRDGVTIDIAPSIAICRRTVEEKALSGVLTLEGSRFAVCSRVSTQTLSEEELSFISNQSDLVAFWRKAIGSSEPSQRSFESYAHRAYPKIFFAPNIWSQLRRLTGALSTNRPYLMRDLAGLNDHALSIWSEYDQPDDISRNMSAVASVNCSRESSKTRQNKSAMKLRKVAIGDTILTCEWHTKLQPQQNRIHFSVTDNSVYVCILTSHLPT